MIRDRDRSQFIGRDSPHLSGFQICQANRARTRTNAVSASPQAARAAELRRFPATQLHWHQPAKPVSRRSCSTVPLPALLLQMPCRLALATPKQKSAIPKPLRVRQHSAHSGPSNPNEPLLGSDRIPRTMRPPLGGASFRKLPADAATDKSWVVPPGFKSFCPLSPALERWAKLGRPYGALDSRALRSTRLPESEFSCTLC
jgi:hypothetical protein